MKLLSLSLANYRQHKASHISFQDGITGILGTNGSGKSSVLEAIAYALYGPHAAKREGRAEGILWQRAPGKSDVEVVLTFELAGEPYTIERRLKQARLFKGDSTDGTLLRNGPQEVTQMVEEGLGMDRETFFNSFFARQKELAFMATVKGTKRQELITRMLGLESIDRARQLVTEDRRALRHHVEGKKAGMGDPTAIQAQVEVARLALTDAENQENAARTAHEAAMGMLSAIRPQFELWNRKAQEKTALEARQMGHQQEQQRLLIELERLGKEIGEIEGLQPQLAELAEHLAPLADVRRQFAEQEQLRAHEEKRQALLGQQAVHAQRHEAGSKALEVVQAQLKSCADAPVDLQLEQLERGLVEREKAHAAARQAVETQLEQMRVQYKKLQERRRHLAAGEHQDCPTCLRPLGAEELIRVLTEFDEQLQALEGEGKELKAAWEALRQEPGDLIRDRERRVELRATVSRFQLLAQQEQDLAKELAALQLERARVEKSLAELPLGFDAIQHGALSKTLQKLQQQELQAGQLASRVDRLPSLLERLRELDGQQTVIAQAARDLDDEVLALAYGPEAHQQVVQAFEAAEKGEREANNQRIKAEEGIAGSKQLVAVYQRQLEEMENRLAELAQEEKELTYLELLETRFKAFRDRLNQEIRPQLSEVASVYLAQLTDGRYTTLDIDDQYDIRVLDDGESFPLERFSGGEQDVVNLCLRLAISQMIADRAGQPLTFMVLDEVFGSLDESRRDNVIGLLEALGHRFAQVILISHLEEIKQALHQVVRVRYDERAGHSVVTTEVGEPEEAGILLELPL